MFGKTRTYLHESKDDISIQLWKDLKREYPEQLDRVMSDPMCELEPSFLGFMETYEKLSYLIPLESIVIDFGCHAAAQAYYFRKHRQYIGVDGYSIEYRFEFSNTLHFQGSIQEYILHHKNTFNQNYFAISNYVPQNYSNQTDKLIKDTYQNCYIYYPGR